MANPEQNRERALKSYYRKRYGDNWQEVYDRNQAKKLLKSDPTSAVSQPIESVLEKPPSHCGTVDDYKQKCNFYSKRSYYRKKYGMERADMLMKLNEEKKQLASY
jgi:hypothetical protein